ncbi:hypothetical protein ES708_15863 [subsurface metagenome]
MVNPDKGQIMSQSRRLSRVHPHQQRARQAGANGNSNARQFLPANAGLSHCLLQYGDNGQQVLAGSHLGDNPTIAGVDFHLRSNLVGK